MEKLLICWAWLIISIFGFNCLSCAQNKVEENQKDSTPNQTSPKTNDFADRMQNPLFVNQITSAMWTLTHDYSDHKRSQDVMKTVLSYLEAFEKNKKGDSKDLESLGGEKALKDKLADWLNDEDQAIRAFSAVMLGVSGDKSYAPQLGKLLQERKYKERDLLHYDRGRAAMALGMLEAKEYTQNLVDLLKSENEFDKVGAAYGLGYMKAKDKSSVIEELLKDEDKMVRQAAKDSLKLMGVN